MNTLRAWPPNLRRAMQTKQRLVSHTSRRSNAQARRSGCLAILLVMAFLSPLQSGDQSTMIPLRPPSAGIRIVDQHGRPVQSGRRPAGGQIFDVAVGPKGNKIRFVPDTITISVGDTVRWTWGSDDHSVTSGTPCTADDQFCSPDNMNCEAGILSNTGTVYEHTFTQAGTYSYFCALHCFAGMTGVVNVKPARRPIPTPRPRPEPHPRPSQPQ
jgi:plastocyanin